ncbi:MAG: hypothetical protein ACQGVK_18310 [Myxococcota bacterium]
MMNASGQIRPRWVTVVATLAIVFSASGVLSSGQSFYMPRILEFQRDLIQSMETQAKDQRSEESPTAVDPSAPPPIALDFMDSWLETPSWFRGWTIINGIAGLLISIGYIVSAILLLVLNSSGLRLFPVFVFLAIGWNVVRIAVGAFGGNLLLTSMIMAGVLSVVVHTTLLFVFRRADKSAFDGDAV